MIVPRFLIAYALTGSPGYYGSTPQQSTPTCTGTCSAGYYCVAGSTSATQYLCAAGYTCPVGSANGTVTPCPAGWACPNGTAPSAVVPCYPGKYSIGAAASCLSCPAGLYGSVTNLANANCSGSCAAGYYCPAARYAERHTGAHRNPGSLGCRWQPPVRMEQCIWDSSFPVP